MRLGLLGGSFDPIHNAHCFIAEAALEQFQLSRVLFLPTRTVQHRAPLVASIEDRVEMVRLAIAAHPTFALDESDCANEATGLTADLLPRLRRRYPHDDFVFIAGSDSLLHSRWRRFDEILVQLKCFAVAPRVGSDDKDVLSAFKRSLHMELRSKIQLLNIPPQPESATVIRERLARQQSIADLVPPPVARYIEQHGLYRD